MRSREVAMTVKTILAAKGGDIVGIEPTANLAAAVRLLALIGTAAPARQKAQVTVSV
jgi:hypothetical protein